MKLIKPTTSYKDKIKDELNNLLQNYEYISGDKATFTVDMNKLLSPTQSSDKPKVICLAETWMKMQSLVKSNDIEVQWHCLVRRNTETNTYIIYDVLMYKQINTGVSTTTDDEEYAKWLMHYMMQPDETFDNIRCHGHSHVNMATFISGRDAEYRDNITQNIAEDDYYLFLILNKKNEINIDLYDFAANLIYEKTDLSFKVGFADGTTYDDWATEQNKLVERPKSTWPATGTTYDSRWPASMRGDRFIKAERTDRYDKSDRELEEELEREFQERMNLDRDVPPTGFRGGKTPPKENKNNSRKGGKHGSK